MNAVFANLVIREKNDYSYFPYQGQKQPVIERTLPADWKKLTMKCGQNKV